MVYLWTSSHENILQPKTAKIRSHTTSLVESLKDWFPSEHQWASLDPQRCRLGCTWLGLRERWYRLLVPSSYFSFQIFPYPFFQVDRWQWFQWEPWCVSDKCMEDLGQARRSHDSEDSGHERLSSYFLGHWRWQDRRMDWVISVTQSQKFFNLYDSKLI